MEPNSSQTRPIGRHMRMLDNMQRGLWGYAAGEIAITTIGILIALAANAWWQNHQDRQDEAELLREMRRELVADTADMGQDQVAYGLVLGAIGDLQNRFQAGSVYTPDMDSLFGVQVLFRKHLVSNSAWQTIQDRGVGLIADDSLRLRMMALYEYGNDYIELWNVMDTDIVYNSVRPYYRTHFTHNGLHGPQARTRPLAYDALARDPTFAYILAERKDALISTLAMYRTVRQDAVWVLNRIDQRLKQLD